MSDTTITALPTASGIDGSVDWLAIDRTSLGTTQKINRSTFLGVSGQPMDVSSSQNVTNKTLDNTNVVTVRDDRFTLQDNLDTTKQAVFQLSGITTATTRTYTLPNASSTIADISTAQTLTNKTLTAPTINNGSITGTTITTDAIVGQSSATSGTIYGLSISSAKISGAGITNATVTATKLQFGTIYRRQGGTTGTASWATTGTSNTDISTVAVFEQVGAATGNAGADVTITFPVAYNQVPLVLLSSGVTVANANPILATVTTTNFSFRCIDSGGTQRAENVFWHSIGQ